MRYYKMILGLVFMSLTLCACGNNMLKNSDALSIDKATPEAVVTTALNALQSTRTAEFNECIDYPESKRGTFVFKNNKMFGDNLDNESKAFIEAVFSNLEYEIMDTEEYENEAYVQIQISNHDLSNVERDVLKYTDTDTPLIEAIRNVPENVVTKNIELILKKNSDGIWLIVMDDEFASAVSGGLF